MKRQSVLVVFTSMLNVSCPALVRSAMPSEVMAGMAAAKVSKKKKLISA